VALGILSVVAVIMTVRADRFSHGERVIYVLIASALLMVEMTSIYADRDRHDKEQADLRVRESEARKKESEAFAALIQNGNKLFENQEQLFGEITGVGSYLFMMPTEPRSSAGGKTIEVDVSPHLVGVHPIHAVIVSIFGPRGSYAPLNYGDVFPHELQRPRQFKTIKFDDDDEQPISFGIGISGSNGSFFEELRFRKVGTTWKRMFAVFKEGKPDKIVCSWMETGLSISAPSKEEKRLWPAERIIRTDGNNMNMSCK